MKAIFPRATGKGLRLVYPTLAVQAATRLRDLGWEGLGFLPAEVKKFPLSVLEHALCKAQSKGKSWYLSAPRNRAPFQAEQVQPLRYDDEETLTRRVQHIKNLEYATKLLKVSDCVSEVNEKCEPSG